MNCEYFRMQISAGIDGELDDAETRELDEHLRTCGACRASSAASRGLQERLNAIGPCQAGGEEVVGWRLPEWSAIERQLRLTSRDRDVGRGWMRWPIWLAASVLLVAGGRSFRDLSSSSLPAPPSEVEFPATETEELAAHLLVAVVMGSPEQSLDQTAMAAVSEQALGHAFGFKRQSP